MHMKNGDSTARTNSTACGRLPYGMPGKNTCFCHVTELVRNHCTLPCVIIHFCLDQKLKVFLPTGPRTKLLTSCCTYICPSDTYQLRILSMTEFTSSCPGTSWL